MGSWGGEGGISYKIRPPGYPHTAERICTCINVEDWSGSEGICTAACLAAEEACESHKPQPSGTLSAEWSGACAKSLGARFY